jgi:glycosyltransferase involved in cell wall biosynthesis
MTANGYYKKTFIIIAAFNEKAVIRKVVEELLPFGFPVIVVDDGSAEDIGSEVKGLDNVIYLKHKVNLGQGAALQTGIDFALQQGAGYLVTFDADGQHCAADIPAILVPLINNEADIVLASRFLTAGSHNASIVKQLVLKTGRWVNYLFTGLFLSDAHNGFRAMNRAAALSIRISENRMAHATEILAQVKKNKLRYQEMASKVTYTNYSRGKGQSPLNSIRIFFDLVLQKLFG